MLAWQRSRSSNDPIEIHENDLASIFSFPNSPIPCGKAGQHCLDRHRRCLAAYWMLWRNVNRDAEHGSNGKGGYPLQPSVRNVSGVFAESFGHGQRYVSDDPWRP